VVLLLELLLGERTHPTNILCLPSATPAPRGAVKPHRPARLSKDDDVESSVHHLGHSSEGR
jgi:hypothetical protein